MRITDRFVDVIGFDPGTGRHQGYVTLLYDEPGTDERGRAQFHCTAALLDEGLRQARRMPEILLGERRLDLAFEHELPAAA